MGCDNSHVLENVTFLVYHWPYNSWGLQGEEREEQKAGQDPQIDHINCFCP